MANEIKQTATVNDKEGYLYLHQEEKKSLKKFFCVLNGNIFTYGSNQKDKGKAVELNIQGAIVRTLNICLRKMHGLEIILVPGVSETKTMSEKEIQDHPDKKRYCFYSESEEVNQEWFSMLFRCTLPNHFCSSFYYSGTPEEKRILIPLPRLKDSLAPQRRALLWRKLLICGIRFDFSHPNEVEAREMKRNTLIELTDVSESMATLFNDPKCLQDTLNMIAQNLFRALPDITTVVHSGGNDDDDSEVFSDPEWPHISLVYELLIHLVLSQQIDNNLRKRLIDDAFLQHLIDLFDSLDQRERECLKTVTHRIYGKLTNRRVTIRKTINNVFYQFLYEKKRHNGIAELLEILASIINGFTVPIRPEHKLSLEKSLIPLHKTHSYEDYSIQLSYCMTLYVAKDPSLSTPIVKALLRYWPYGCTSKETWFLSELEDLLELVKPEDIVPYREPLFKRIAKCIGNTNVIIGEKTLYLWNSQTFYGITVGNDDNRRVILPIIFKSLFDGLQSSSENIQTMASNVLSLYQEVDQELYSSLYKSMGEK
ncbi:protein phosphatase 2A regulatory subunit B [Blastocystis sp. ATCC 50177/Nand II]|uniref:Protein phosphatase 2A regulatory subunit B n=1 Tax=Blastocystis sp. subtype 1 (strain ATCC 50177 / NandII) TaxID=478820 RepID=A0A196SET8_BLAHN|nr:protein phosphatase 2A regulatory subunit B [Blastocystis sp. ATCC 50177/Nand II]